MSSYFEYLVVGSVLLTGVGLWLFFGRPSGTDIFLAMLAPLEAVDRASAFVVALRDNQDRPSWQRAIASGIAKLGVGSLYLILAAVLLLAFGGRFIRRLFGL